MSKAQKTLQKLALLLTLITSTLQWEDYYHYPPQKTCEIIIKRGKRGKTGPKGLQGPKGPVGNPGEAGEDGKAGDKGDKGDKGLKGKQGEQGEAGVIIKGTDGKNGNDGRDADDLFCTCPDEHFSYLCCVLDNKNDSFQVCREKQDLVKNCEGECLKVNFKEECKDVVSDCEGKCDNGTFVCAPAITVVKCKASCPALKGNCLLKKGCVLTQENNCRDNCKRDPANDNNGKIVSCQATCKGSSQQTAFLATCGGLFLSDALQICKTAEGI